MPCTSTAAAAAGTSSSVPGNGELVKEEEEEQQQQQSWMLVDHRRMANSREGNGGMSTIPDARMEDNKVEQSGFRVSKPVPYSETASTNATFVVGREIDSGGDEEEYLEIMVGDLSFKDDKYKVRRFGAKCI